MLDGLPLAIELAASRVQALPPDAIAIQLRNRLSLLHGGPLDQPRRLRSMRDAISWSYDLLDGVGQRTFRGMSVFAGGADLEAAITVVGRDIGEPAVLRDSVFELVDNSLLLAADGPGKQPRFTMLETIREFGLEQLEARGEARNARDRHAGWCLDLVHEAFPYWFTSNQGERFEILAEEYDNIRTALQWMHESGDRARFVTLVGLLWPFWFIRSHTVEGTSWLRRALEWCDDHQTIERLRVLIGMGGLVFLQGDEPRSTQYLEEAQDIAGTFPELNSTDSPVNGLAVSATARGDLETAARLNQQALEIYCSQANKYPSALPLASMVLGNMAWSAYGRGERGQAAKLVEEALALQQTLDFAWGKSSSLLLLARLAHDRGDAREATRLYSESLMLTAEHLDVRQITMHVEMYAILDHDAGRAARAAMMLGARHRLREVLGSPADPELQMQMDQIAQDTKVALGEERFSDAWRAGRALSLNEVIAMGLKHASEALSLKEVIAMGLEVVVPVEPHSLTADTAGLGVTQRELDVLCLLAEGWTDREIGDALFISRRTVNTHVSRILSKLDVTSRRQAVAVAKEGNLLVHCPASRDSLLS
jgi:non-specific serine/threonine protein kinase